MNPIILASQSPRRKQLLREMGLKIKVVPANIKENPGKIFFAAKIKKIAYDKAAFVAKKFKKGIVIGADTVVVVNNKVYGKPKDIPHARKMLAEISGKRQYVYTGVAVIDIEKKKEIVILAKSVIKMIKLTKADIEHLANKNLDKAGGYGIQEDDTYLRIVSGSVTNVVGLPVEMVGKILRKLGVFITE